MVVLFFIFYRSEFLRLIRARKPMKYFLFADGIFADGIFADGKTSHNNKV
jgi:hypothetical protein